MMRQPFLVSSPNAKISFVCSDKSLSRLPVEVFPVRSQITLGGCPYKATRSLKSESCVMIVKSCVAAYSQICASGALCKPSRIDMARSRESCSKRRNQLMRDVLVEEELHAPRM